MTVQLCPACNGQGLVSKPSYVAGDLGQWMSTTTVPYRCGLCNGRKVIGVLPPSNAELAERAKALDAQTVVRNWLDRHVGPVPTAGFLTRDAWLDWAAQNFLDDPEIAQHLQVKGSR